MSDLLRNIEELRGKFDQIKKKLDIDNKKKEVARLEQEMQADDFWSDQERAVEVSKKNENLKKEIEKWDQLEGEIEELEEVLDVIDQEEGGGLYDEACEKYDRIARRFNDLEFYVLFSGKYDRNNAIVSIHAGSGGIDAQDWAEILERMYLRFVEKKEWKATVWNRAIGQEAGIKNVTFLVEAPWAYGFLRSENGVHRLVRISPFDGEGQRHTSFALVEVVPEIDDAEEVDIKEDDLRVDTFTSSGPGGQHANKTESAVRMQHLPTGIIATCQNQKSQHQNKETALKIIRSKIHQHLQEEQREKQEELKGDIKKAEWGGQIRSYVFQPYTMVKDHRTAQETSDVDSVMDGDIGQFIEAYLKKD